MLPMIPQDLESIRRECRRMATRRALISATATVVPIPFTDIATDIMLLRQVIPAISERFGLSKEQIDAYDPKIAILIYESAKQLGAHMVGRYITKELLLKVIKTMGIRLTARQVTRFVPFAGQIFAVGISFSAMKLIINNHINHCYDLARVVLPHRQ